MREPGRGRWLVAAIAAAGLHAGGLALLAAAEPTSGAAGAGNAGIMIGLGPSGGGGAAQAAGAEAAEAVPADEAQAAEVAEGRTQAQPKEAASAARPVEAAAPVALAHVPATAAAVRTALAAPRNEAPVRPRSGLPAEAVRETREAASQPEAPPARMAQVPAPMEGAVNREEARVAATVAPDGLQVAAAQPEAPVPRQPPAAEPRRAASAAGTAAASEHRAASSTKTARLNPADKSGSGQTARAHGLGAEGSGGKSAGSGDNSAGGGDPGAKADYIARLRAWLSRHQRYPDRARMQRQQGTAFLYFAMDRNGQVLDYRLERSSGHALLDREVEAMIRRAEPLPRLPDSWQQTRLELVVPIQFALR